MSKIQRYDPCTFMPDDNGEIVFWDKVKDRLVPDEWPGVYPEISQHCDSSERCFFFRKDADVIPVFLMDAPSLKKLYFHEPILGIITWVEETEPSQWGPRIPMVKP
jgi:hypothetical protein